MPDGSNIVTWEDLQACADEAFNIWVGQPELGWAKQAWEVLVRAGLAKYEKPRDRWKVCTRFLALAGIYHDFCWRVFDEPAEPDYDEWARLLGLSEFRVGQLVGGHPGWDVDEETEIEPPTLALKYLVDEARAGVVPALLAGFGDTPRFFVSLWRSKSTGQRPSDQPSISEGGGSDDEDELSDRADPIGWTGLSLNDRCETDEEILMDATAGKLAGFEWIEAGCLPLDYP